MFNGGGLLSRDYEDSIRDDRMLLSQAASSRIAKAGYRLSLMEPSIHTGQRIPSEFPQASATASLRFNFNITPNASGRFLYIVDPFRRDSNVYNASTLDGLSVSGAATVRASAVSATFIDMFRIVSCELKATYTGQLQTLAGYLTGATASNYSGTNQNIFFNFENIENSQNKLSVSPLNGIRLLYVPNDPSMIDYFTPASYDAGTSPAVNKYLMIIYGEGLPATSCIRIDYSLNIEYLSRLDIREYIPHYMSNNSRLDFGELATIKAVSSVS